MTRKFALLIGNAEYKNLPRLTTPVDDVANLARVLREPKIGGFDEVITLVNRSAQEIRLAVAQLFKQKTADDLMLLYFSGHGVKDVERDASLYLAVHDTDKDLLSATAIPASFILDEIDHSRSERNVLILDCCYSGAFARGAKAGDATIGTGDIFKGSGRGKVVLTASDAASLAWEGNRLTGNVENSLFTYYLIHGLESGMADKDGDGQITLNELYEYAYTEVIAQNRKQTPRKWEYEGQGGAIVLARNPVVKPEPLAAELQDVIKDNRPLVRKGAIPELDRILRGPDEGLAKSARIALESLARDDSRTVSEVARATLIAFDQTHPPSSGTKGGRGASLLHQTLDQVGRMTRSTQQADHVGREKAEAEKHEGNTGVEIICENPLYSFIPGYYVTCKIESTLGKINIKLTLGNTQFVDLQPDVQYHLTLNLKWAGLSDRAYAADTTFILEKGEILKLSYRPPMTDIRGRKLVVKGRAQQK